MQAVMNDIFESRGEHGGRDPCAPQALEHART
jgi:hypothetical protein